MNKIMYRIASPIQGKAVRLILAAFMLLSLALAACSGPAATPRAAVTEPTAVPVKAETGRGAGGTLRILHPQAPAILNPHLSAAVKDQEPSRITYEPLASFAEDGELVPFLAAEIPSLENGGVAEDGRSVTWKLRQDVRWSDGEPFTASDVLFTYQFVTNPDVKADTAANYKTISEVVILDTYTVQIQFKDVNPAWALPFVGVQGSILPRHVFQDYVGANAREAPANKLPVGTGPFRAMAPGIKPQEVLLLGTQIVETNKIVFEPNPYFREADKPFFSRVEYRGGGTPNEAARLVLKDGGVDIAYNLGTLAPETLLEMEEGGKGKLMIIYGSAVERILINRTDPNEETADGERSSLKIPHPFFKDLKVRQAFAHAIDREAIAALYGPTGRPATNNLMAPPQFSSSQTFYPYDPDKARELLDSAGWKDTDRDRIRDKDGKKMKVVFQAAVGAIVQATQQVVKKNLEAIGVEVELKIVDAAIMFSPGISNPDSAFRFNADLQTFSVRSAIDPSSYMESWTCSRIPQKSNDWAVSLNLERWCSPKYDELYQQTTVEVDPGKRQAMFIEMNDMQIQDVVMIPLVLKADVLGVGQTIEGVSLSPWDRMTWKIMDWRQALP